MSSASNTVVANVTPDVEGNQDNQCDKYHNIQTMENWAECIEVITENRTYISQQKAPWQGAKQRVDTEFGEGHFGNACRK